MKNRMFIAALVAAAGTANAQWSDDFNRPNGPIGGSWNVISGTWGVLANQGTHQSPGVTGVNEVIQHSAASLTYDVSVSKLDVFCTGTALQFSGFFIGLGILGRPAGNVEALDIVFLAASGLGLLLGQQRLPVRHRDLVIIGMDFGEGQETLAIAAIFHKGGLQRRLNARHLGEIDIALERPLGSGLEIKFLDLGSVENDHPGLFRVAGVDKHALGHGILRRHAVLPAFWRETKERRPHV